MLIISDYDLAHINRRFICRLSAVSLSGLEKKELASATNYGRILLLERYGRTAPAFKRKGRTDMKEYTPAPVDTSDITLPEALYGLTEEIARHVHDTWAQGRLAEGWQYGEKKDSDAKTTPLLVAYEDLSDSEKEYDRQTAFETLTLIVKLGYRIEKADS